MDDLRSDLSILKLLVLSLQGKVEKLEADNSELRGLIKVLCRRFSENI